MRHIIIPSLIAIGIFIMFIQLIRIAELEQEVSNLNKKLDIRDEQIIALNKEIDNYYQFDKVIKELRRVK